jgi:hypothetical protein
VAVLIFDQTKVGVVSEIVPLGEIVAGIGKLRVKLWKALADLQIPST